MFSKIEDEVKKNETVSNNKFIKITKKFIAGSVRTEKNSAILNNITIIKINLIVFNTNLN